MCQSITSRCHIGEHYHDWQSCTNIKFTLILVLREDGVPRPRWFLSKSAYSLTFNHNVDIVMYHCAVFLSYKISAQRHCRHCRRAAGQVMFSNAGSHEDLPVQSIGTFAPRGRRRPQQLEWTAIPRSQMKYILHADLWSDLYARAHVFCCRTLTRVCFEGNERGKRSAKYYISNARLGRTARLPQPWVTISNSVLIVRNDWMRSDLS